MKPFYETPPSSDPTAALCREMQALVPTLATARLVLRAPRIEDFDDFAKMVLGPQGRFYGACETRADAWGEFVQLAGTWYLRGHGAWTVTDRESGAVLGFVQIGAEPGDAEPELGFIVAETAQGRGVAREAAAAVRDEAVGPFALPALVSYIDPDNARSIRLAERLGATRDHDAEAALPAEDRFLVFRHHPAGRPA